MKSKNFFTLLSVGIFAAGSASAGLVFTDNFTDGTVDGWTASAGGAGSVGNLTVTDGTSLGLTGNALSMVTDGTAAQQGPAIGLGSTYTLANTGDSISLNFDFVVDVLVSSTGFFRYGLFDEDDGTLGIDEISGPGYFGQISTSATDRGRVVQTQDPWYTGTQGTDYEIKGLDNAGWQIAADTAYNASLTIVKTASGATSTVSFSSSGSDVSATESELLGSAFTSFDTIFFGINANNATVLYDNVEVDFTVVPEPSTFALLAGCLALGSVMLRRRMD